MHLKAQHRDWWKIKEKKLLQYWILETRKYIHLNKSIRRGVDFGNQEKSWWKNSGLLNFNCGNVQQVVVGYIY